MALIMGILRNGTIFLWLYELFIIFLNFKKNY
jgi:hypothetical protein